MTGTANPSTLWAVALGLTAALGSYGLACVFPFAALAALAAVTLPTRHAAILIGATWVVNQLVGFTLLPYPHDGQAVVWVRSSVLPPLPGWARQGPLSGEKRG